MTDGGHFELVVVEGQLQLRLPALDVPQLDR